MPASTRDALMRTCLEHPDDIDARMILADHLEGEVGTPAARARAELIRVQVAIARLGPCHCSGPDPTGCARCREGKRLGLWVRQEALLRKWGRKWLPASLRFRDHFVTEFRGDTARFEWDNTPATSARFGRGFVEEVGYRLHVRPDDTPMRFVAAQLGEEVRGVLAACPLAAFTVGVAWHTPELRFAVRKDPGFLHPWVLSCDTGVSREPAWVVKVWEGRRGLLAELPYRVSQVVADTEFTPADDEERHPSEMDEDELQEYLDDNDIGP